ncbi:hypothetical protein O9H85_07270 [Paenibacillus filicis]|uniref:Uncharacterized protein n=1 Tax=Paenibacillus gyeongsangnamensis TaxID=3388067 RepID=A0ABT4Q6A2_9BACL|nr:hypothetical protein [Paenibacillus filicis]MCZ8512230.1 hypothetical protein [Paenibacillus filicis]
MKKKWLMVGSAVGISSVVMVTTGLSAMASTSGYDAYKSAFKNTKTVQNVSVQAEAVVQDNGSTLTDANGSFKVSLQNRTASGTVKVSGSGAEQSLDVFKQAGQTVLKPGQGDVYYVKQERDKKDANKLKKEQKNEQDFSPQIETVVDALVGNLKDYVTVDSKADGSKQVSVELTNSQIPAVVNAIAPIAIKEATSGHKHLSENKTDPKAPQRLGFDEHNFLASAPKLTQDIKIEKVAVKADINASNYIDHQQADITVSGKDDTGAAHTLTLHLNADLTGFNSTTPDTVDLTGKQVQQLKQGRQERESK